MTNKPSKGHPISKEISTIISDDIFKQLKQQLANPEQYTKIQLIDLFNQKRLKVDYEKTANLVGLTKGQIYKHFLQTIIPQSQNQEIDEATTVNIMESMRLYYQENKIIDKLCFKQIEKKYPDINKILLQRKFQNLKRNKQVYSDEKIVQNNNLYEELDNQNEESSPYTLDVYMAQEDQKKNNFQSQPIDDFMQGRQVNKENYLTPNANFIHEMQEKTNSQLMAMTAFNSQDFAVSVLK